MKTEKPAGPSEGPRKATIPATSNEARPGTGEGAAIHRAAHQVLDHPRIFDDPLALRIIGRAAEATLRPDLEQFHKPAQRDLRVFIAVRSRYAEDELARSIERGVRQYVILGAGLDTFAYRNSLPESVLRVFEVDHPATQAEKRRRLEEAGITVPKSATFISLDFERQRIADGLRESGFRSDEPAFFSWLGVTRYLSREAVMSVLISILSAARAESEIVFDFSINPSLPERLRRLVYPSPLQGLRRLAYRVIGKRTIKSKFRLTLFDPSSLVTDLKRIGFVDVELLGRKEMNRRYCKGRTDGLRVRHGSCLVKARV